MNLAIGVSIYKSNVSDEFYNFLMTEYTKINSYERLYQNENYWNGSDYNFINDTTRSTIEVNVLKHAKEYIGSDNLNVMSQWINIQAHDGYLPTHDHSGNISYVIYLKVPEYLSNYTGKRPNDIPYTEGAIHFNYGHKNSLFPNNLVVHPEEKMILMFPSELQHFVHPFRNRESLRVSVSGNLLFKGV